MNFSEATDVCPLCVFREIAQGQSGMGVMIPLDRLRRGFCQRCGEWLTQQSGGLDQGDLLLVRHDLLWSSSESSEPNLEEPESATPPFVGKPFRSSRTCATCGQRVWARPRWEQEAGVGGYIVVDQRCDCTSLQSASWGDPDAGVPAA